MVVETLKTDYRWVNRVSRERRLLATLPTDDPWLHDVELSPDGRRLVYTPFPKSAEKPSRVQDRRLVQEDGSLLELGKAGSPMWSEDGARLAFVRAEGDSRWVVVDGVPSEEFSRIHSRTFSPDGRRFAFGARRGGEYFLVVDGCRDRRPGPVSDGEFTKGIRFSPDASRLAYVDWHEEGRVAVIDGRSGRLHHTIGKIRFSPDSRRVAYCGYKDLLGIAKDRGSCWVFVDGEHFGPYDDVSDPDFSPDGRSWACRVGRRNREIILRDGQETPFEGKIMQTEFLPTGELAVHLYFSEDDHIGFKDPNPFKYSDQEETVFIVSGPRKGETFPLPDDLNWISPDGRSTWCHWRRGRWEHICRDGKPGPAFKHVWWPAWSPDGETLAYFARVRHRHESAEEDRDAVVVCGDRQTEPFDENIGILRVVDARTIAFAARRGREVWWEVWRPY